MNWVVCFYRMLNSMLNANFCEFSLFSVAIISICNKKKEFLQFYNNSRMQFGVANATQSILWKVSWAELMMTNLYLIADICFVRKTSKSIWIVEKRRLKNSLHHQTFVILFPAPTFFFLVICGYFSSIFFCVVVINFIITLVCCMAEEQS